MNKNSEDLFSHKFIAGTLQNVRKCPQCHSDFQCRYDKFGANYRPLLLHCGHSVCESCIYQSRQTFICPICSKPVPMATDVRLKKKLRDKYDLNFYMFGEICNYSFFRENATPAQTNNNNHNSTISTSALSDSSVIPCGECNVEPAVGGCADCHAVYCHKCFRRIHRFSKILQKHNLQKFQNQQHVENLTPRPKFCHKHKHIFDCFCDQCRINCCKICIKNSHEKHSWHRLAAENKHLRDDLLNAIEVIKTSRDHLRTAQQEVSSTQSTLENYAIKTYMNVSDYFLELHNFLQNEQRKIKEEYDLKSQHSQTVLNDAAARLEKHQSMLNTMRVNLERYAETPPIDINVRQVLAFYYQQLHNMQCQLKVSKIVENPFVFDPVEIFKEEIEKSYFHAFVDPQIQIYYDSTPRVAPDLRDQTMMTLPPSPSLTASSNSVGKQNNYVQKKAKNKNQKNSTKHDQTTKEQVNSQLDFTDSFHPYSDQSSSLGNLKNHIMARITYLKHPQHFFIQQEQHLRELNELSKNFQALKSFQQKKPQNIVLNNIYMIYYDIDMQWHRALIKRQIDRDTYEVLLVDIGKILTVDKETFHELEQYATAIPHAAVRCSIYDLLPIGESWSDEAINFLREIVKNKRIHIKLIEKDVEQYLKVDIIVDENNERISVRESFLYTGLARALYPPSRTKQALLKYHIPKQILETSEILNVKMRHWENPQEFYVTKIEQIDLKFKLRDEIDQYYKKHAKFIKPLLCGAIRMGCVVLIHENEWHRGSIEEMLDAGLVRVRLVDEGLVENVHWSRIYSLKAQFAKQREYAIKCRLADIEPLQENNYEWTNEAIAEFKTLTTNPTLQMIICSGSQNEYLVVLNVTRRNCSINIGAVLVKNGHAISTGKHTMNSDIYRYTQDYINSIKSNSQNASKITIDEEEEARNSKNEFHMRPLKRTPVKMVYIVDPGHFYLQLDDLIPNIRKFQKQLQAAHEHLSLSVQADNMEWFEGDHCLVSQIKHAIDNSEEHFHLVESHWYRGVITANNCDTNPAAPYSVFLRDFGITVHNVSDLQLYKITQDWDRISSAVIRCHLACIGPTAGESLWTNTAIEYFKHTIKSFQQLSATLHDKREKNLQSTPIMLWGTISETFDPLAPCISRHSSINRVMVKAGLAHLTERFDLGKQIDQIIANELSDGEISIQQWFKHFQDNTGLRIIDKVAQEEAGMEIDNINDTNYCQSNLLWNLEIKDTDVLPTNITYAAPKAWQVHKNIGKSVFVAYPTYVDLNCVIYLHHSDDHDLLSQISVHISKSFANYIENSNVSKYAIGQACIAKYHLDNNFYRGIVQGFNADDMEYSVQFIDYGNVESVPPTHMRPFAPFPEMPAMASKYRLENIEPKKNEHTFSTNVLDVIHNVLVGKMVKVRVAHSESIEEIQTCSISIGTMDLASFLLEKGLVERIFPKTTSMESNINVAADVREIKSSKDIDYCKDIQEKEDDTNDNYYTALFERLEHNAVEQKLDTIDKVPSAPRRKPMFDNKEYAMLRAQKVLEPADIHMFGCQKESSLEFNVEDADDVDVLELGHTFSESFMVDELSDDIKMIENDSLSSDRFFPKDTSTVSTFSGTECFKRSFLPNSVTSFFCQVVRIISPTILQILPQLTEFQFRENELQLRIENAAKTAPPLKHFVPRSICLACYTKDNKYYRAVIRSFNVFSQTADVLYVDYLNTETLPANQLLQCPDILATLPLRTFRVRLYGIKPNSNLSDRKVCRKLAACIGQNTVFARVRHRPCDADCEAGDLIQVTLHKNAETKTVIYKQLLEDEIYLRF